MDTPAHTTLLRLREADIVRLCGFRAASEGIALASGGAVRSGKRVGARLEATVTQQTPCLVTVELGAEAAPQATRWSCTADAAPAPSGPGCAHVAAVLTVWVRAPEQFPGDIPEARPSAPVAPAPVVTRPAQHELIRPAGTRRRPASPSLRDTLDALSSAEVVAMARRVTGADLGEHEARAKLGEVLTSSETITALRERLPAEMREVYDYLLLMGGSATAGDLDGFGLRSGMDAPRLREGIIGLARHGLAFPSPWTSGASMASGGQAPAGWRVPAEIRSASNISLPAAVLPTRGTAQAPVVRVGRGERVARVASATPQPLLHALALIARAPRPLGLPPDEEDDEVTAATFSRTGLPVLAPGDLHGSVMAKLAAASGLEAGLLRLARRLTLWARHLPEGALLAGIADQAPAQRLATLTAAFELWAGMPLALELADLDAPESGLRLACDVRNPAFSLAGLAEESLAGRRFALGLLRAAGEDWHALDDLLALAWRLDPYFLRSKQRVRAQPTWWLERAGHVLRADERAEWLMADGAVLRALLCGPLVWWGAVEVAEGDRRAPVALRVRPLGRLLLGSSPAPDEGALRPQLMAEHVAPALGTSTGIAAHPLASGAVLDAIACWARPTGIAGGRVLYAADPTRAVASRDLGLRPDSLRVALRAADPRGGERAGARLLATLEQLGKRYGHTRIVSGWALLDAADEPMLAEALAAFPNAQERIRRIGPHSVLIHPDSVVTASAALAKRGLILPGEDTTP
ncbi:MAG TPA: hypothetical protein VF807_03960 [Ktedonobacterales bacterium]